MNEKKSTREGFGDAILEEGKDKKLFVLTADLRESTCIKKFSEKYPERFIECGVAEQNMIGVAAGIALTGKTAVTTSFGVFTPGRTLDQIRINVCYNNANVKIAATHCGINVGEDGATHQALEDISALRAIPNITILSPCDYAEAKKATKEMLKMKGPCYLRLGREKTEIISKEKDKFEIGKINILSEGKDATIIATGGMTIKALTAAIQLKKEGINTAVLNCHTIKPIDEKTIIKYAKKTGAIITAEEHEEAGGLGSAVSEILSKEHPTTMEFIAIKDQFGQSGKSEELFKYYHLDEKSIINAVKNAIRRKKI
jgi:transketolase